MEYYNPLLMLVRCFVLGEVTDVFLDVFHVLFLNYGLLVCFFMRNVYIVNKNDF